MSDYEFWAYDISAQNGIYCNWISGNSSNLAGGTDTSSQVNLVSGLTSDNEIWHDGDITYMYLASSQEYSEAYAHSSNARNLYYPSSNGNSLNSSYLGHSGNADLHFPSSQLTTWLDNVYAPTGTTGTGISHISGDTQITGWDETDFTNSGLKWNGSAWIVTAIGATGTDTSSQVTLSSGLTSDDTIWHDGVATDMFLSPNQSFASLSSNSISGGYISTNSISLNSIFNKGITNSYICFDYDGNYGIELTGSGNISMYLEDSSFYTSIDDDEAYIYLSPSEFGVSICGESSNISLESDNLFIDIGDNFSLFGIDSSERFKVNFNNNKYLALSGSGFVYASGLSLDNRLLTDIICEKSSGDQTTSLTFGNDGRTIDLRIQGSSMIIIDTYANDIAINDSRVDMDTLILGTANVELLKCDAGTNRVGIHIPLSSVPNYTLEVSGCLYANTISGGSIQQSILTDQLDTVYAPSGTVGGLNAVVDDTSPQLGGDLGGQGTYGISSVIYISSSKLRATGDIIVGDDIYLTDKIYAGSDASTYIDAGSSTWIIRTGGSDFKFNGTTNVEGNLGYTAGREVDFVWYCDNAGEFPGEFFHLDGGNGRVGVREPIPLYPLHISGTIYADYISGGSIQESILTDKLNDNYYPSSIGYGHSSNTTVHLPTTANSGAMMKYNGTSWTAVSGAHMDIFATAPTASDHKGQIVRISGAAGQKTWIFASVKNDADSWEWIQLGVST